MLFSQDLLKHFDQNQHGYSSLHRAHASMVDISNHLNKVQKRHDYDKKVQVDMLYTTQIFAYAASVDVYWILYTTQTFAYAASVDVY